MTDTIVSNNIKIINATSEMRRWCEEHLIIDNPDYYKKQAMGKSTWATPRDIHLYSANGCDLYIPFGCLQSFYKRFHADCTFQAKFSPIRKVQYISNINLYPYQAKAVESALQAKNGILVMPCGSGKTQTALDIIARIGGKVLWLTHTQDLLKQSMDRAKGVLDTDATYGTITAGKVDIGEGITFATVQTMCKIDLHELKYAFDVIIIDECQHCCGSPTRITQFYKVVNSLSARYKIGLTATPKRADGLEESMFALLGGIFHTVTRQEVEIANTTCPVKVKTIEVEYMPNMDAVLMGDGTLDYTKLVDDMINDKNRFQRVLEIIEDIGTSVLVLANRVAYLQQLDESFNGRSICISGMGQSIEQKRKRREALQKLNNGEIDAVFGTYALAREGLDIPNLKYVVFATPEKNEVTVIQSAGRVSRKADGKEYGTVIDIVDSFSLFRKYAVERRSCYRKIDAEVL